MAGPDSVSSSQGANPYLQAGWNSASPLLQQAGLDSKYSTYIGNVLNGNTDAAFTNVTDGIIDGAISNPVANAAVKGVVDIVKIVLTGQYKTGEDVKAAGQNLSDIQSTGAASNALADAGNSQGKEILDGFNSDVEAGETEISDTVNTITVTLEDGSTQVVQISEQNKEMTETYTKNQELLTENNNQIEQKQTRLNELAAQIAAKKSELGIASEPPVQGHAPKQGDDSGGVEGSQNNEEGNAPTQFSAMPSDGITDPDLQNLISEYNNLGPEIQNLQLQNQAIKAENQVITETLTANTEAAQEVVNGAMEVSDEQSAYIDEQTNSIVGMCNDAQSAIGEVQKMLQGQFPKLDKVTLVKLATSMTKSAICGTNGGLLAAAASAMGVGSVFSFGATAQKAAELGAASGDQFAGSAKHIATNVAGKIIQQQMTAYMQRTFADIGQMIGVDLSQMQSVMNQFVQEQVAVKGESVAQFQAALSENPVNQGEGQGSDDKDSKPPENPAA